MNTSIVITLDTRRSKKDGSYPLIMRLSHNGATLPISLGVSVHKKDWDEDTRIIRKSYQGNATRINNEIQKRKADAVDIILKTDTSKLSINAIRDKITSAGSVSFVSYTRKIVDELNASGRTGNARCYKGVADIIESYAGNIKFDQINYAFLKKFEAQHLEKGGALNGLSVYLRTIRAVYNRAVKEGLADSDKYPFKDYKIKSTPTRKRAIDIDNIIKIAQLDIAPNTPLFDARNYFIASYMMYGMNFIDMAYLKRTDIINDRIQYRRRKTAKLYDIKITPQLKTLLSYYKGEEYVFPIMKRIDPMQREKSLQWARKRYNTKLKKIAKLCGIEDNLTSYVARHTFSTQAVLNNVPLNALSTMLGHSSLKVTEVYIKGLPSEILDSYNATVLGAL